MHCLPGYQTQIFMNSFSCILCFSWLLIRTSGVTFSAQEFRQAEPDLRKSRPVYRLPIRQNTQRSVALRTTCATGFASAFRDSGLCKKKQHWQSQWHVSIRYSAGDTTLESSFFRIHDPRPGERRFVRVRAFSTRNQAQNY